MLLYIIRHGDPIYPTDSLTDRGKIQAEAVGKRMFDAKIDRIFSSPMGRAMQTAEPACRLLGWSDDKHYPSVLLHRLGHCGVRGVRLIPSLTKNRKISASCQPRREER